MSASLINQSVDETLKNEFMNGDEEYRYAYAEDFLNTYIATQIRVLREQRDLKQEELAEAIGTKQSGISRLENVNHSRWKTETLRKVARALNVRLKITFETFGSLLGEDASFSKESLKRPKFEDDPVFQTTQAAPSNTDAVTRTKLQAIPPTTANSVQLSLGFASPTVVNTLPQARRVRGAKSQSKIKRRPHGRKRAA